jgi:hypothetical protein
MTVENHAYNLSPKFSLQSDLYVFSNTKIIIAEMISGFISFTGRWYIFECIHGWSSGNYNMDYVTDLF